MINQKTIEQIKNIVFRFLDPEKDKVFIFGSQALKQSQRYSDIDLGIRTKRNISLSTIAFIKDKLEDSNIPYTIDIVNFNDVSLTFKKLAEKKIISLN